MTVCGRCKGRTWVHPIRGVGQVDCPVCRGTGIKPRRNSLGSHTVSVPLNGAKCIVCGEPAVANHHVVSQSRLNRYLSPELARAAKNDRRNVTPLCFACHDKAESGTLHFECHELHPHFAAFVYEFDLLAALPRYMTCGAAQTPPERQGRSLSRDGSPREEAA